ncbi:MAG: hypothetical protein ACK5ME_09465 [Parahaliea sp.]
MTSLLLLLLLIFGGVALMVLLGQRYGQPMAPEKAARMRRWLTVLVGLLLVLSLIHHFFRV